MHELLEEYTEKELLKQKVRVQSFNIEGINITYVYSHEYGDDYEKNDTNLWNLLSFVNSKK